MQNRLTIMVPVVVALAFVGLLAGGCSSTPAHSSPTAKPAASVAHTATKAATHTPTPKPKATPTPIVSAAELAYRSKVVSEDQEMVKSIGNFSTLMTSPQLGDVTWTSKVAVELATWRQIYADAKALTPPPGFEHFQSTWVGALASYNQASYDVASGVDTLDASTIDKATTEIQTANGLLTAASALIPN